MVNNNNNNNNNNNDNNKNSNNSNNKFSSNSLCFFLNDHPIQMPFPFKMQEYPSSLGMLSAVISPIFSGFFWWI